MLGIIVLALNRNPLRFLKCRTMFLNQKLKFLFNIEFKKVVLPTKNIRQN